MPTEWYHRIVSAEPVTRGTKSFAFEVPEEYIDGPAKDVLISIQAAFIRPKWTLVFVDHNVMIQFHVMQASHTFEPSQLAPGSSVCIYFACSTPLTHCN